jgi:hypothetical protein
MPNMRYDRTLTSAVTCLAAGVFLAAWQLTGCSDDSAMPVTPLDGSLAEGAPAGADASTLEVGDATIEADATTETGASDDMTQADGDGAVDAADADGGPAESVVDSGDEGDSGDGDVGDADAGDADAGDADAGDAETGEGGDAAIDTVSLLETTQGPDCVACAQATGAGPSCLSRFNCEALADAGAGKQQNCYDTLGCELRSNCAANATVTCYCGSITTLLCETDASAANGACDDLERKGLGTLDPVGIVVRSFYDSSLGAGMANNLVECLGEVGCNCFGPP